METVIFAIATIIVSRLVGRSGRQGWAVIISVVAFILLLGYIIFT